MPYRPFVIRHPTGLSQLFGHTDRIEMCRSLITQTVKKSTKSYGCALRNIGKALQHLIIVPSPTGCNRWSQAAGFVAIGCLRRVRPCRETCLLHMACLIFVFVRMQFGACLGQSFCSRVMVCGERLRCFATLNGGAKREGEMWILLRCMYISLCL